MRTAYNVERRAYRERQRRARSVEHGGGPFVIRYALCALLFLFAVRCPLNAAWAAEEATLLETIEAAEKTATQITALTKELKDAKTPAHRRQIQTQIEELQRRQQELLPRLEELVGPLPTSVSKENPIPLEEQLKAREQRHETRLEGNVDKR